MTLDFFGCGRYRMPDTVHSPPMTAKKSATTSAKSGTSATKGQSPFDEIAKAEKEQEKRLQTELQSYEKEKIEVQKAVADKEAAAEEELKDAAKKELMEYRETELSAVVKEAEKGSHEEIEALEASYGSNEDAVVASVIEQMTAPDSPLLT